MGGLGSNCEGVESNMSADGKRWKTGYTYTALIVGWIVSVVLFAVVFSGSPTLMSLPGLALIIYASWRTYRYTQARPSEDLRKEPK
jgi:hypothetical protein